MSQDSKIRSKLALSRCNMYGGMWVVAKPITQLSSMLATSLAAGKLETSIGSASPHHLKHPAALPLLQTIYPPCLIKTHSRRRNMKILILWRLTWYDVNPLMTGVAGLSGDFPANSCLIIIRGPFNFFWPKLGFCPN